jgi:hypothetical protein
MALRDSRVHAAEACVARAPMIVVMMSRMMVGRETVVPSLVIEWSYRSATITVISSVDSLPLLPYY